MYTAGSLFSGIGGIDLAFARAGFDIRWQVELEPFCQAVLRKHAPEFWPHAQVWSDVKHVGRETLESVDVIFGGFPCTDISHAGKGAGIKVGTRSGLWFEFARIIGDLRPRAVFLENVAAITTRDGAIVVGQLTALGYDARWGIVPASAIGAPHQRERWWCVAHRNGLGRDGQGAVQRRADGERELPLPEQPGRTELHAPVAGGEADNMAHAPKPGLPAGQSDGQPAHPAQAGGGLESKPERYGAVGNADEPRLQGEWPGGQQVPPLAPASPERRGTGDGTGERTTQSRLGGIVFDGLSGRLDSSRYLFWAAGPHQPQHAYEPPRTGRRIPNRAARLQALGNAVVVPLVQVFAEGIADALRQEDGADQAETLLRGEYERGA